MVPFEQPKHFAMLLFVFSVMFQNGINPLLDLLNTGFKINKNGLFCVVKHEKDSDTSFTFETIFLESTLQHFSVPHWFKNNENFSVKRKKLEFKCSV